MPDKILLNPKHHSRYYPDEASKEIMLKTIDFFETRGLALLKKDDHERVWYREFLDFIKENKIFYRLLTPVQYGDGSTRWDTWRNQEYSEILAFYGLQYWYTWQVSILGLGPVWMTKNESVKKKAAEALKEGAIFAFGLSERTHGADIYSTEMTLTPLGDGKYVANGSKYYIGNANEAKMVSTLGKLADTGEFVFFIANYQHPQYELVKNVVNSQNYVGEYTLKDYPVCEEDILAKGSDAWDMALNTVNVGKYNLGWASTGICTHAFYEAINHASKRKLYNMYVTDFPHVKRMFTEAYSRLLAMKLYGGRVADYMRSAGVDDRRYLLYDPIMKMKVTTQGEEVINLLWDVIAAKGFEKDTYFEMAARDIRALPKLEGTVHVNIALIVKFMPNYLFNPKQYPEIPRMDQPADDTFLFNQGQAKGLGKTQFHDYSPAYDLFDTPNLKIFKEQIATLKKTLFAAPPSEFQQKDIDFVLTVGELFTLIVYGQLVLENAKIYQVDPDLVDQIFDFMVRDFSKFALEIHNKPSGTETQMDFCRKMMRKPDTNDARYNKIWNEYAYAMKDQYEMNP